MGARIAILLFVLILLFSILACDMSGPENSAQPTAAPVQPAPEPPTCVPGCNPADGGARWIAT